MNKDEILSKKLTEAEEGNKYYFARQVESSDRERVGAMGADAEIDLATGVSINSAPVAGGATHTLETSGCHDEGVICSWIECAQDRRSWAEVTEARKRNDTLSGKPKELIEPA